MFDNLPFLNGAADASDIDELKDYLAADLVPVKDAISWWQGKRQKYPRLSRMAIDYLNIPATSVEVERIFSRGRLLLSHVRNRLTAESTRASICLAVWAQYGLVDTTDMFRAAQLPEVEENE
ncbi:hATC-domain-containing protein [Trametes versicolor FP-101664 SS1]|uniref:hATC-domain-containing protein n=1 Tax=Trametes versicolor (strain FP-101664) TaxID=717944 RepID=UPI00046228DF|nr:hATC-domain-containing protein [Trametes versicolor FP-101664 SS1]EIW52965.1 hATC-domain-containing protein [Trametes versicolor FP-101664 SS1]